MRVVVAGAFSESNPATPVPATVLITPRGSIRKIRWPPNSATYRLPAPSRATFLGALKTIGE